MSDPHSVVVTLGKSFKDFRRPTDVSPEELWAFRGDGLYLFCQEN